MKRFFVLKLILLLLLFSCSSLNIEDKREITNSILVDQIEEFDESEFNAKLVEEVKEFLDPFPTHIKEDLYKNVSKGELKKGLSIVRGADGELFLDLYHNESIFKLFEDRLKEILSTIIIIFRPVGPQIQRTYKFITDLSLKEYVFFIDEETKREFSKTLDSIRDLLSKRIGGKQELAPASMLHPTNYKERYKAPIPGSLEGKYDFFTGKRLTGDLIKVLSTKLRKLKASYVYLPPSFFEYIIGITNNSSSPYFSQAISFIEEYEKIKIIGLITPDFINATLNFYNLLKDKTSPLRSEVEITHYLSEIIAVDKKRKKAKTLDEARLKDSKRERNETLEESLDDNNERKRIKL